MIGNKNYKKEYGFALLISIVITSLLLLVSFVVANLALKQILITYASKESQTAFYNAESGLECARYWDNRNEYNLNESAFATTTPPPPSISCNNDTIITGETIPNSALTSLIGGGGEARPTSLFKVDFTKGCAIVTVNKGLTTTIISRGYNTCNAGALRRFERTIELR